MVGKIEEYLKKAELSTNTIQSYLWTVRHFLTREPRSFGHQLWIDIQHATCPVRPQPAPATDVQDQFLVANREVVQDRFLREALGRVALCLLRAVVALVEVQVKRRHLGLGGRVYVCLLLGHHGLEKIKQPLVNLEL